MQRAHSLFMVHPACLAGCLDRDGLVGMEATLNNLLKGVIKAEYKQIMVYIRDVAFLFGSFINDEVTLEKSLHLAESHFAQL